jgi:ethanolaminephosphotransferase
MPNIVDPEKVFRYSYASEGCSILTPLFWKVFCKPVLRFLPRYVSPNLISLTGNVFSTFAFLLLIGVFGDFRTLAAEHPLYFLIPAFCVLIYHVLDNIDGTQARRTHSSSPLGEFFDHWLDSFNSFMLPLGVLSVFGVSGQVIVFVLFFSTLAFWSSHREHKEEGKLIFPRFSELEGILLVNLIYFAAAFTGSPFWASPLPLLNIPLILVFAVLAGIGYLTYPFALVKKYPKALPDLAGLIALLIFPCLWFVLALKAGVSADAAGLLAGILLGLLGSKKTGDLLGDRLLGARYIRFDIPLLILGSALVLSGLLIPRAVLISAYCFIAALLAFLVYQFAFLSHYVTSKLRIRVFRLTDEQREAVRKEREGGTTS